MSQQSRSECVVLVKRDCRSVMRLWPDNISVLSNDLWFKNISSFKEGGSKRKTSTAEETKAKNTMVVTGKAFSSCWWTLEVGHRRIISRFHICYSMGFSTTPIAYGKDREWSHNVGRTFWPAVATIPADSNSTDLINAPALPCPTD
ncbi:UNVERIFIED_CONTAM: hypothetical protein Sindi_0561100 [Sesamum indicum]